MQCEIVVLLVICVGIFLPLTASEQNNNLWLVQLNENDDSIENVDELAKRYGYRLYRSVS